MFEAVIVTTGTDKSVKILEQRLLRFNYAFPVVFKNKSQTENVGLNTKLDPCQNIFRIFKKQQ
jgi:hypothetical protein